MKQREKLVTFLGQVSAHMQWLRIYILHMIRMVNMRQTNWSHFWGNFCLTRSWVDGIHVAEESDRLRIYICHMIVWHPIAHRSWSHFCGKRGFRSKDGDMRRSGQERAATQVGHIFGATFGSHAVGYV